MSKLIYEVDDLAEGVYMASGDGNGEGGDCYSTTARIHQEPQTGRGDYRIQVDAHHDSDHNSNYHQQLEISFNQPVSYVSCNGNGAWCSAGDGTNTLFVDLYYWNNHVDNIGFGDLVVTSEPGLAITGVVMHDLAKQY